MIDFFSKTTNEGASGISIFERQVNKGSVAQCLVETIRLQLQNF